MNILFLKLENLRQRLDKGEKVTNCAWEHNDYVVHLTNEPPIIFDDNLKERADNMIKEYGAMQ